MQSFLAIFRRTLEKPSPACFLPRCINVTPSSSSSADGNHLSFPISTLGENGSITEMALSQASQTLNAATSRVDERALANHLRASKNRGCFSHGKQLHSYILRSGFVADPFISSALISFYLKFELLNNAQKVFDEIPEPTVVCWNSMISGCARYGSFSRALGLFVQLDRSGLSLDPFSLTACLSACSTGSLLQLGKSIHSKILKCGCELNLVIENCLIDMYGKCGSFIEAIRVFDSMAYKSNISWNSLIAACVRNQRLEQAFQLLLEMGNPDTISYNELISGIANSGDMEVAKQILSTMPSPNSSSWNSVITGYVNRSQAWEALEMFCLMHLEGMEMDQFTFSSILSGIASLSAVMWGMVVHCCTIKYGLDAVIVVGSALIDMYCKCGLERTAELIFLELPWKNVITWNTMISGFAHNGNSSMAIHLFEELKKATDLKPDGITFLNVLLACWHNQIPLQIATKYFESMIKDYGIVPTEEHCSSMIRLMGMEGEVRRAERMIYELGFGSCALVWRALLGACEICGDLNVAEVAATKIIELEGINEFTYIIMSNMYASQEKWSSTSITRDLMRDKGLRKQAGQSWIEQRNVIAL